MMSIRSAELEHTYTCRDLLMAPSMRNAKLLTEDVELDTPITSVNVMEVPDIEEWTRPGEFLITTGYPFKDDENRLLELIGALSKIKVAALGIKLHRFIDKISPEIIDYAKAIRFPIIELAPQANFSQIVQEVTKNILERDMESVIALQNQVEQLISRFSEGESLENILTTLEHLTGYAALLTSVGLKPILGQRADEILKSEDAQLTNILEKEELHEIDVNGRLRKIKTYPIYWNSCFSGHLVLLEDRMPFQKSDHFLIGQIKSLLSLELRNRTSVEELKGKYRNRFLQGLLNGRMTNETDIYLEAKSYHYAIDFQSKYVVAVVAHTMGGEKPSESELVRFCNQNQAQDGLMTAVLEGNLAIIIPNSAKVKDRLRHLYYEWSTIFEENCISFCLSKPYPVIDLHKAYEEAIQIMKISYRSKIADQFIEMENLGIYAVLALIPKSETVDRFVQRQLSALKSYDNRHNSMLFTTLKVYLQKNCNAKTTAEALYTHYNTIIYRLERIKQVLNVNLDDVEVRFALRLALKLDSMRSVQTDTER